MIPVPVHCIRCGEFTGEHYQTDSGSDAYRDGKVWGRHEHLEDCVELLGRQVRELHNLYEALREMKAPPAE